MTNVGPGEFHAMLDVLTELANDADSLTLDEALMAIEALGNLQSEVRRCTAMVETAAKVKLEDGGPRQLGQRVYALKEAGKWRYHHDEIDREVVRRALKDAINPTTGEIVPNVAVIKAVKLMANLYRSDATVPKKTTLVAIGFDDTPEIARWERSGKKIEVIDMEAPEGAG